MTNVQIFKKNIDHMSGPKISEVNDAVDKMKCGKSPRHDQVCAQVLKQVDIKQLKYLFNVIND